MHEPVIIVTHTVTVVLAVNVVAAAVTLHVTGAIMVTLCRNNHSALIEAAVCTIVILGVTVFSTGCFLTGSSNPFAFMLLCRDSTVFSAFCVEATGCLTVICTDSVLCTLLEAGGFTYDYPVTEVVTCCPEFFFVARSFNSNLNFTAATDFTVINVISVLCTSGIYNIIINDVSVFIVMILMAARSEAFLLGLAAI